MDWAAGRLVLRRGEEVRSARLEEVRALEVRGARVASGAGRERAHRYRCRVVARLAGAPGEPIEIPLLETRARGDPTRPYREAASFAAEVARALDVPWEWKGYLRKGRAPG